VIHREGRLRRERGDERINEREWERCEGITDEQESAGIRKRSRTREKNLWSSSSLTQLIKNKHIVVRWFTHFRRVCIKPMKWIGLFLTCCQAQ